MAATILNTSRAIEVSVFVVRAFVRLSRVAANYRQLALRPAEMEAKLASYDQNFRGVFDALRKLMQPSQPETRKRCIGLGRTTTAPAPVPTSSSATGLPSAGAVADGGH